MNPRRMYAVSRKEFLHIIRDARSLALALLLPFVMLMLFGYALSLDVDQIPTVVHDRDKSPESRDLVRQFEGARYFNVLGHVDRDEDIDREIDASRALLGITVPENFGKDLQAGAAREGAATARRQRFQHGVDRPRLHRRPDPGLRPEAAQRPADPQGRWRAEEPRGPAHPVPVQLQPEIAQLHRARADRRDPDDHRLAAHLADHRPRVGIGHHGTAAVDAHPAHGTGARQALGLFRPGHDGHADLPGDRRRRVRRPTAR